MPSKSEFLVGPPSGIDETLISSQEIVGESRRRPRVAFGRRANFQAAVGTPTYPDQHLPVGPPSPTDADGPMSPAFLGNM